MSDDSYIENDHVNKQIVDAVDKASKYAFGLESYTPPVTVPVDRMSAGGAAAYEKAAQAAALAVQDGVDYQRNILSISTAAQGKALAMMFADKENLPQYLAIFVVAMVGSLAADLTSGLVTATAGTTLKDFPRS